MDFWDGIEHPLLDEDRLISLWVLAESCSPDSFDELYERSAQFEVISDGDERRRVRVMPPRMRAALASLGVLNGEGTVRLAQRWACTKELEWIDEAWVLQLLRLVTDSAETAQTQGKTLILWYESR
jgi:hypothetical protein